MTPASLLDADLNRDSVRHQVSRGFDGPNDSELVLEYAMLRPAPKPSNAR